MLLEPLTELVGKAFEAQGLDKALGRTQVADRPDLAHALVEDALAARASDIHLEPQDAEIRVRLRIDGAVSDVARDFVRVTPASGRHRDVPTAALCVATFPR